MNRERVVEAELSLLHLMEQFNHHGDFHRASGMERVVWVIRPLGLAVEGTERDSHFGVRIGDALLNLLLGQDELGLLRAALGSAKKQKHKRKWREIQPHKSPDTTVMKILQEKVKKRGAGVPHPRTSTG